MADQGVLCGATQLCPKTWTRIHFRSNDPSLWVRMASKLLYLRTRNMLILAGQEAHRHLFSSALPVISEQTPRLPSGACSGAFNASSTAPHPVVDSSVDIMRQADHVISESLRITDVSAGSRLRLALGILTLCRRHVRMNSVASVLVSVLQVK